MTLIGLARAKQVYRYIGGLRNADGRVTWTVGVTAATPEEALDRLAVIFSEKVGRRVRREDVGIVRRQSL